MQASSGGPNPEGSALVSSASFPVRAARHGGSVVHRRGEQDHIGDYGRPVVTDATAEFEEFVVHHSAQLGRLAYLLTGDPTDADDLAADVLLAAWQHWDRVSTADQPIRYVRGIAANMAASRIRRASLSRAKFLLFRVEAARTAPAPSGDTIDVGAALARLPARRRACVVLRLAFDQSEREVAATLGISVGTVKSQTSKAVAQLRELLGEGAVGLRGTP